MKQLTDNDKEAIRATLFYESESGRLCRYTKPGRQAGSTDERGIRHVWVGRSQYLAHQLAWFFHHGTWPTTTVWHVNGDHDDNRIDNLRLGAEPAEGDLRAERLRQLLIYDPSSGLFAWRINHGRKIAGSVAGNRGQHGYWVVMIDRQLYLAHRLAWLYVHGEWPEQDLDHKNRCRDDNRIANLRGATRGQNSTNKGAKTNASGHVGANSDGKGRYRVRIQANGARREVGTFDRADEASDAYKEASRHLHGEYSPFR